MNVLMVGPHKDKIKGGISSVIKNYLNSKYLKDIKVYTLATVISGSKVKKLIYCIYALIKMILFMSMKNIDIVHVHTASGKSFYRKSLFIKVAKFFNKKIILHIHGGGFEEFYWNEINKDMRIRVTNLMNKCDNIIVLSDIWKKKVKKMTNSDITVINNSVEEHSVNVKIETSNRIVFIGRLEKEKGIYDLIEVSKKIIQNNKKIKFIICGDGEINLVKEIVNKYRIDKNFELLGWVNEETIGNELNKAKIFVLPSHKEAMPMSILEAMSYGVPIVSTNVGSIPEFVINKRNGFLFEAKNLEQLEKCINELLDNNKLRSNIIKNNIIDVKDKYSNSINHKKLRNLYFYINNKYSLL